MVQITIEACAKVVAAATAHCIAVQPPVVSVMPANVDSLSTAIAFGSAAIMAVTLVVVIAGIFVGMRWGQNVVREAKEGALAAAKAEVNAMLLAWLNDDAPALVRTHVEFILAQSPTTPGADEATDQMGEHA